MTTRESVVHPMLMRAALSDMKIPMPCCPFRITDLKPGPKATARNFLNTMHDRFVTRARALEDWPTDQSMIGRGMLITGDRQVGKTVTASTILIEMYLMSGHKGIYTTADELIGLKQEQIRLDGSKDLDRDEALEMSWYGSNQLEAAALLVLDDFGYERKTKSGFGESEISQLLRKRNTNARPTIVVTSLSAADLGEWYPNLTPHLIATSDLLTVTRPRK